MKLIEEIGGGILFLQMPVHSDDRGEFIKFMDRGLQAIRPYEQRQLNYVVNKQKFTSRGLHYQKGKYAESKIFRVLAGSIYLVALNVDNGSLFYKKTFTAKLKRADTAIWVPHGFATGYCTLEDNTLVLYSSDNDYHPEAEAGLRWDDPLIKIPDLDYQQLIISEKDRQWRDFN